MNKQNLFDAINMADDKYISEAALKTKAKTKKVYPYIAAAACFLLLFSVGYMVFEKLPNIKLFSNKETAAAGGYNQSAETAAEESFIEIGEENLQSNSEKENSSLKNDNNGITECYSVIPEQSQAQQNSTTQKSYPPSEPNTNVSVGTSSVLEKPNIQSVDGINVITLASYSDTEKFVQSMGLSLYAGKKINADGFNYEAYIIESQGKNIREFSDAKNLIDDTVYYCIQYMSDNKTCYFAYFVKADILYGVRLPNCSQLQNAIAALFAAIK